LALGKRSSAELEVAHARALTKAGRAQQAIEGLQDAASRFPNNQPILLSLAMNHQQNAQPEEAIKRYQQLIELSPDNPLVLNNLAWLYYETDNDQASDLARKAYELAPDTAAIADTYGWILFESAQHTASLDVLKKAHELAPESQEIAMHLVEAYMANGDTQQAKVLLERFKNEG